jgi:hypothetical protein
MNKKSKYPNQKKNKRTAKSFNESIQHEKLAVESIELETRDGNTDALLGFIVCITIIYIIGSAIEWAMR